MCVGRDFFFFFVSLKSERVIAAGLLVVFCAVVFSHCIFFAFLKTQKTAFRQELLSSGLFTSRIISVSQASLYQDVNGMEWREHNRELIMNGIFYEVIKVEDLGSYSLVHIIKDEKENSLFAAFFAQKNKGNGIFLNLLKCISLQYDICETKKNAFLLSESRTFHSLISPVLSGYSREIYLPPAVAC